jgi:glycosyltransferase involved in cell wall biosynthesis
MRPTVIVVPCFNEEQRLDTEAFRDSARQDPSLRFLFVDDGSTDGTRGMLETLHAQEPSCFEVHALPSNTGKAEAVRQGLRRAFAQGASYVGYWDADLSTPLAALPEFRGLLDGDPEVVMVVGSRVRLLGRRIERRPVRHYLGRIFATFASLLVRLPVYDTQCGAKLMRATPEIRGLLQEPFRTQWFFDVELLSRLARARALGGGVPVERAVHEVPLRVWRDVPGSKLGLRESPRLLRELFALLRDRPPRRGGCSGPGP